MSDIKLGIIGGGQLGSMMAIAAKKLNIKTVIFCDDVDAPAQNFCNNFIFGNYDDKAKIAEFIKHVDIVTFEFENIPYETLNEINKLKPVLPKPAVNRLIQHRLAEKDFINKSRLESTGNAGKIQISDALAEQIKDRINVISRGPIQLKGVGEMKTYWLA